MTAFTLSSESVADGAPFAPAQTSTRMPGGRDESPHLAWSGAPEGTRSFAITVFDPDAPREPGFWHWVVADIPAEVASLPAGAGDDTGSGLPPGAVQLPNTPGSRRYLGAAPPAGHGRHRYIITVHALDVDHLDIPEDTQPEAVEAALAPHILGRATLTATAERPAS